MNRFPIPLHDVKAAVRWLRANAEELEIDAERIAVVGSSSGGHLAALLGITSAFDTFSNELGEVDLEGEVGDHLGTSSSVQAVVTISTPFNLLTLQCDCCEARICLMHMANHVGPSSNESILLGCYIHRPSIYGTVFEEGVWLDGEYSHVESYHTTWYDRIHRGQSHLRLCQGFCNIAKSYRLQPELGQEDECQDTAPLASPEYYLQHASADDVPPFFLVHGKRDPVIPHTQSEAFQLELLARQGIVAQMILDPIRGHEASLALDYMAVGTGVDMLEPGPIIGFLDENLQDQ